MGTLFFRVWQVEGGFGASEDTWLFTPLQELVGILSACVQDSSLLDHLL